MDTDQLEAELRTLLCGLLDHRFKGVSLPPDQRQDVCKAICVALVNTAFLTAADFEYPATDFTWLLREMAMGFEQRMAALAQARIEAVVGSVTAEDRQGISELEASATASLENLEGKPVEGKPVEG